MTDKKMCDCNQGRLPCTCKPQTDGVLAWAELKDGELVAKEGFVVTCTGVGQYTVQTVEQAQGLSNQPQGEPVALPEPCGDLLPLERDGWNACLDEIAKLGPLYSRPVQGEPAAWVWHDPEGELRITDSWGVAKHLPYDMTPLYAHANPAEVELRELVRKLRGPEESVTSARGDKLFTFMSKDPCRYQLCEVTYAAPVRKLIEERDTLRAQLAERGALLREALCHAQRIEPMSVSLFNRIDAALSASAEPSAPKCCTPTAEEEAMLASGDYRPEELWGGSRPTCPKCIKLEPSAPIELMAWVPVTERKPERNKLVLVAFDTHAGKNYTTAKLCQDGRAHFDCETWYVQVSGGHQLTTVTHWCDFDRAALERKP